MKTQNTIFRILVVAAIALFLIEKIAGTGSQWAIVEHPILILLLLVVILFGIGMEVSVASIQRLLFYTLSEEAQARYLQKQQEKANKRYSWWKSMYAKLIIGKREKSEEEILLDHDYDGIKELDNNLPPWWLYGFYATIIFAVVYMARYHIFDGISQDEEYRIEVAEATKAIEEYRKTAKGLVDASTVILLTDIEDLRAGEAVFKTNCAVCHRADGGGGIGPNLTDNYWILGGTIKDVFQVIAEGGRPGKGMISWKQDLKPLEMAQVSSYILSLQDTNPADAKAPEGDLLIDNLPAGMTVTQGEERVDETEELEEEAEKLSMDENEEENK